MSERIASQTKPQTSPDSLEELAGKMVPDGLRPGIWMIVPRDPHAVLSLRDGLRNVTDQERRLNDYRLPLPYAAELVRIRPDFLSGSSDDVLLWDLVRHRQTTDQIDRESAERAAKAPARRFIRWISSPLRLRTRP